MILLLIVFNRQLERIHVESPDKKVGIVTFSSEVDVLGDGSGQPKHFAGDKLDNYDELIRLGQEHARDLDLKPISDTYEYVTIIHN